MTVETIKTPEGTTTTQESANALLVALEAIAGVFRQGRKELEEAATWTKH